MSSEMTGEFLADNISDPFFLPEQVIDGILTDRREIIHALLDLILLGPKETQEARLAALAVLTDRDSRSRHVIAAELGISPQRFAQHLENMSEKTGIPWRLKAARQKKPEFAP
jgi:DNA-binding CsgD family transcriptional regulator